MISHDSRIVKCLCLISVEATWRWIGDVSSSCLPTGNWCCRQNNVFCGVTKSYAPTLTSDYSFICSLFIVILSVVLVTSRLSFVRTFNWFIESSNHWLIYSFKLPVFRQGCVARQTGQGRRNPGSWKWQSQSRVTSASAGSSSQHSRSPRHTAQSTSASTLQDTARWGKDGGGGPGEKMREGGRREGEGKGLGGIGLCTIQSITSPYCAKYFSIDAARHH